MRICLRFPSIAFGLRLRLRRVHASFRGQWSGRQLMLVQCNSNVSILQACSVSRSSRLDQISIGTASL